MTEKELHPPPLFFSSTLILLLVVLNIQTYKSDFFFKLICYDAKLKNIFVDIRWKTTTTTVKVFGKTTKQTDIVTKAVGIVWIERARGCRNCKNDHGEGFRWRRKIYNTTLVRLNRWASNRFVFFPSRCSNCIICFIYKNLKPVTWSRTLIKRCARLLFFFIFIIYYDFFKNKIFKSVWILNCVSETDSKIQWLGFLKPIGPLVSCTRLGLNTCEKLDK